MRNAAIHSRPEFFTLNPHSPLFGNLVFAGLGSRSGSTHYHDATGNYPGTLTGYTTSGDYPADKWQWDSYLRRNVLGFDGTDDYVGVPIKFPSTAYTVSAWCWQPVGTTGYRSVVEGTSYGGDMRYYGTLPMWEGNSNAYTTAGTWNHCVWNTSLGMYLNGVYNAAAKSPLASTTTYIGKRFDNGNYWLGNLADILIFFRSISAEEIKQLADPSNYMLSVGEEGTPLLLPPRRRFFACAVSGETPTTNRRRRVLCGA